MISHICLQISGISSPGARQYRLRRLRRLCRLRSRLPLDPAGRVSPWLRPATSVACPAAAGCGGGRDAAIVPWSPGLWDGAQWCWFSISHKNITFGFMDVYGRCRYESNIIHSDVSIVGRPPFTIAKLVNITPISLWFMVLTTIVTGANLNQLINGGATL